MAISSKPTSGPEYLPLCPLPGLNSTLGSERTSNWVRRLTHIWRFSNQQHLSGGESLVVPMEELMCDLPVAVRLEQGEYVGSSGVGAS
jgi:hypothetical protein